MQSTGIHSSLWPNQSPALFSITTSATVLSCLSQTTLQDQRQHLLFITSWARRYPQGISTFLLLFPLFTVTIPGFKKTIQSLYSFPAPLRGTGVAHAVWEPQEMCGRAREWMWIPKTLFPGLAAKQPQWGFKISEECFSCCKTGGSKTTKKTSLFQTT